MRLAAQSWEELEREKLWELNADSETGKRECGK